jgi:hypothetical protein
VNLGITDTYEGFSNVSQVLVGLISFWHFTVVRGNTLTPSIAFTSVGLPFTHALDDFLFLLPCFPFTVLKTNLTLPECECQYRSVVSAIVSSSGGT